jgi:hypothetical protein
MSPKNSDNGAEKARRKIELARARMPRVGSLHSERERRANFKTKKIKREFVGRDPFVRQKGRGFINTATNFTVKWTPTKLVLASLLIGIPYLGLIVFLHGQGMTIVSGILIAVAVMLLGVAWLVRFTDRNL